MTPLPLDLDRLEPWGPGRAKIPLAALDRPLRGRLVLVTAMSPSPAGDGKTTVSIGLADALNRLGETAAVALRQPSMGPVFGAKGGGTGGGRSRVVPEESLNLHFTGDFHAVTAAHDLLAAAVDSHVHHGNALGLERLVWHRVLDVNDRALRRIRLSLGGAEREGRFDITGSSEVMSILALARSYEDLRGRLGRLVVGFTAEDEPVRAEDVRCAGAMAALLRDALMPNLVRTLEGSPALVHTGPFANLSHGTSSVLATRAGLQGASWLVQEAGFGADLGGEKFLDLFCPVAGVWPCCAVVVITLRALKFHGGRPRDSLFAPDPAAVEAGLLNAMSHLHAMASFGLPVVAALNDFDQDPPGEAGIVLAALAEAGFPAVRAQPYSRGGEGVEALAETVLEHARRTDPRPLQAPGLSLEERLERLATRIYGASGVDLSTRAAVQLAECRRYGGGDFGVCVAKTPYSFTDDPARVGRPWDFRLRVREVHLLAGAGFVVPICGDLMTMPGLGRHPNLERIDLDPDGTIRL